ncbi:MAG: thiamine pyrophosphate-dependent enzyme [Ignavibacteria bacterium]|nr:thiamine pyrophosphate-dependent enzyme [Ignavibacteria bacterium]
MTEHELKELELIALKVRENIIRMATNGGCFIGASLSCADLILYIYKRYLNINKDNLISPERDYFLLSKGHAVPALYATLAEVGIIEKKRLEKHLQTDDYIYLHPNTNIPSVEFHSGSLGHLLSIAMGIAYDCKYHNQKNKIIVLLGDGELNEGSIWEGILVASAKKLDNLIVIIDRNKFQANIETEKLIPLEPLEDKLIAFGLNTIRIDGHNFIDIDNAFSSLNLFNGKVNVIIADTVRGKGVPSIESRTDRWYANFTKAEIQKLLTELYSNPISNVNSNIIKAI